jgi:hypothetical protein
MSSSGDIYDFFPIERSKSFHESIQHHFLKTELTGKEFNVLAKGRIFYKTINEEKKHNGLEFKPNQLHHDTKKFNPQGECQVGGIYFCEENDIHRWCVYGRNLKNKTIAHYYAKVVVPDKARVYIEQNKVKADVIYLEEFKSLWDDEKMVLNVLNRNGYLLEHVQNQNDRICEIAVHQDVGALQYVKDQKYNLCMWAVRENYGALQFVRIQTDNMCEIAINQNYLAIEYIKDQKYKLCHLAIMKDYFALRLIRDQTLVLCKIAVQECFEALRFVIDQNIEICRYAVQCNFRALDYIRDVDMQSKIRKEIWPVKMDTSQKIISEQSHSTETQIDSSSTKQSNNIETKIILSDTKQKNILERLCDIKIVINSENKLNVESESHMIKTESIIDNKSDVKSELCTKKVVTGEDSEDDGWLICKDNKDKILTDLDIDSPILDTPLIKSESSGDRLMNDKKIDVIQNISDVEFTSEGYFLTKIDISDVKTDNPIDDQQNKHFSLSECMKLIKQDYHNLLAIDQTDFICKYAISCDYRALEYVRDQNDEICIYAINQTYKALQFVHKQNYKICMHAVQNNGLALQFVKDKYHNICMMAVKQNGLALEYVDEKSYYVCKTAVEENGYAIIFIIDQQSELCDIAVRQNGLALQCIQKQTYDTCAIAICNNKKAINYVRDSYTKLQLMKDPYIAKLFSL